MNNEWERLLGEIACLDSIPLDAREQFDEMLRVNFPSAIEPE